MWVLKFLPNWIFYGLLVGGVVGLIASKLVPGYYRTAVQAVCAAFFVIGLYMAGAIANNEEWLARVKELEAQVAESEKKAAEKNVEIVEKIIQKEKVITQKGEDIIKYIDREIVKKEEVIKYVENCPVPKDIIDAHNAAAAMGRK